MHKCFKFSLQNLSMTFVKNINALSGLTVPRIQLQVNQNVFVTSPVATQVMLNQSVVQMEQTMPANVNYTEQLV